MKKFLSLLLCLSLCFALVLAFTACSTEDDNENDGETEDDGKITYTVTVTDKDGNPVEGAKILFLGSDPIPSDNNGKVKKQFDTEQSSLSVMLTDVPDGYVKLTSSAAMFSFGSSRDITIKLDKVSTENVTYTVKVVDQNGDAVEGVTLQICYENKCLDCDATDSNGESKKEFALSAVEGQTLYVKLLDKVVPDGYTIPAGTLEGGYHVVFPDGEATVTVEIVKN